MRLTWLPIIAFLLLLSPLALEPLGIVTPWGYWQRQLQHQQLEQQVQSQQQQLRELQSADSLTVLAHLRRIVEQTEVSRVWLLDQQHVVSFSSEPSMIGVHQSLLPIPAAQHLTQFLDDQARHHSVQGSWQYWSVPVGNHALLVEYPSGNSASGLWAEYTARMGWLWLCFCVFTAAAIALVVQFGLIKPIARIERQLAQPATDDGKIGTVHSWWREFTKLSHAAASVAQQMLVKDQQLVQHNQNLQTLYQRVHDGVIVADVDGNIEFANPRALSILGIEQPQQLLGQPLTQWLPEQHRQNRSQQFEWSYTHPDDGLRRLLQVNVELTPLDGGYRQQLFIHDISAQHRAEQQLRKQAFYDVSGVYNQAGLQQKWRELSLAGADAELWIMVAVGIDRLRDINLSFGLEISERLTHYVAASLQKLAPRGGFCGRLSRERYLIAYPLQDQRQDPTKLCQQLNRHSMLRSMPVASKAVRFSVSCGYVRLVHTHPFASGLQRCLTALDLAQEQGLGQVQHVTDQQFDYYALQNRTLLRLHNAIARKQLLLYIHPKLRMSDNAIIGGEALVRWQDKSGWISPAEFIPMAERADIIHFIDQYMVNMVCGLIGELRPMKLGLSIAVNVSAKFFGRDDFRQFIRQTARQFSLRPGELEIEITEYSLLQDDDGIRSSIALLDKLGIGLAIDDFGTGASNLQSLIDLPIKHLKIDKSFTEQLVVEGRGKPVVESIFSFARPLGIAITAEGIETEQQCQALHRLGCDYAQGFLFYKPMPQAEFVELVANSAAYSATAEESAAADSVDNEIAG